MATNRMFVFAPGEIYHVFNRGVERRSIFTDKREFERAIELIRYYRFAQVPLRYSTMNSLPVETRRSVWAGLENEGTYGVNIFAYCLMPNHFHILLRQVSDHGVSRFVANISNGYTKYFNTKHERVGPLFQGTFKAVRVETDEQCIHLTRYIHINPTTSFLVPIEELDQYPWSSFPEYVGKRISGICDTSFINSSFKNIDQYKKFVYDQIAYAREVEKIKHLTFEAK